MLAQPFKTLNERADAISKDIQVVSERVVSVTQLGIVAFALISLVAVTALIIAVSKVSK